MYTYILQKEFYLNMLLVKSHIFRNLILVVWFYVFKLCSDAATIIACLEPYAIL